jgi:hypothetical protein
MKIFSILKKDEEYSEIHCPLAKWSLEPMGGPPKQSGVPTSPLDGVILSYTALNIFII